MIRLRFPEYYLPIIKGYDIERLYKGLMYYVKDLKPIVSKYLGHDDHINLDTWWKLVIPSDRVFRKLEKEYQGTLKYLLFNNLIKLDQRNIYVLTIPSEYINIYY